MCIDCLSKYEVKVEIYPKMALLIETDNWQGICPFHLLRVFANVKGILILESNYNRMGHIIYIRIVNQIKIIFEV